MELVRGGRAVIDGYVHGGKKELMWAELYMAPAGLEELEEVQKQSTLEQSWYRCVHVHMCTPWTSSHTTVAANDNIMFP